MYKLIRVFLRSILKTMNVTLVLSFTMKCVEDLFRAPSFNSEPSRFNKQDIKSFLKPPTIQCSHKPVFRSTNLLEINEVYLIVITSLQVKSVKKIISHSVLQLQ